VGDAGTVELIKLAVQGGSSVLLGIAVVALWRENIQTRKNLQALHKAHANYQDRLIRILLGQRDEEPCDERDRERPGDS
jgi:hypothetical protein